MLEAYGQLGNITAAAEKVNIERKTHYRWIEKDPKYAKAFEEKTTEAIERLEQEARRRAVDGTLKPVFQNGVQVGTVREFSDTLLIFLLKGANPNKYRDRMEHSGPKGGPIPIATTNNDLVYLTDEEFAIIDRARQRALPTTAGVSA